MRLIRQQGKNILVLERDPEAAPAAPPLSFRPGNARLPPGEGAKNCRSFCLPFQLARLRRFSPAGQPEYLWNAGQVKVNQQPKSRFGTRRAIAPVIARKSKVRCRSPGANSRSSNILARPRWSTRAREQYCRTISGLCDARTRPRSARRRSNSLFMGPPLKTLVTYRDDFRQPDSSRNQWPATNSEVESGPALPGGIAAETGSDKYLPSCAEIFDVIAHQREWFVI